MQSLSISSGMEGHGNAEIVQPPACYAPSIIGPGARERPTPATGTTSTQRAPAQPHRALHHGGPRRSFAAHVDLEACHSTPEMDWLTRVQATTGSCSHRQPLHQSLERTHPDVCIF